MNKILSMKIRFNFILQASGYYLYLNNNKISTQIQEPNKKELQSEINDQSRIATQKQINNENIRNEQKKIENENIITPNQNNNQNEIYDHEKNNLPLQEDEIFQRKLLGNVLSWPQQDQIYQTTCLEVLRKYYEKQDQLQKNLQNGYGFKNPVLVDESQQTNQLIENQRKEMSLENKQNSEIDYQSEINNFQEDKQVQNPSYVSKSQEQKQNSQIEQQNATVSSQLEKIENLSQNSFQAHNFQEDRQDNLDENSNQVDNQEDKQQNSNINHQSQVAHLQDDKQADLIENHSQVNKSQEEDKQNSQIEKQNEQDNCQQDNNENLSQNSIQVDQSQKDQQNSEIQKPSKQNNSQEDQQNYKSSQILNKQDQQQQQNQHQNQVAHLQDDKQADLIENHSQVNKSQEEDKQNSEIEKQNEVDNSIQDKKEDLSQISNQVDNSQKHQQNSEIQNLSQVFNSQQNEKNKEEEGNNKPNTVIDQLDKEQWAKLNNETMKTLLELVQIDRYVEQQFKFYVRQEENFDYLWKNYNLTIKAKKEIQKYCNAMIPVRGDGNCFYTAFGFQLLQYFLSDQSYYEQIKGKYQNIDVQMKKNQKQMINDQKIGQMILQYFFSNLEKLLEIKDEADQKKELQDQFAAFEQAYGGEGQNFDGLFNAQTVIFLRNLAFKLVMESDELRDVVFDKENLLIWEKECNNNEPIIKLLAENLKVHVNLLFFDNRDFQLMEYGKENDKPIILLMKPGHYNIGVKYTH